MRLVIEDPKKVRSEIEFDLFIDELDKIELFMVKNNLKKIELKDNIEL